MATRRKALVTLAVAPVSVALAHTLPDSPHAGHGAETPSQTPGSSGVATRKPVYFEGQDYEVLGRLVDLIIPRTETPGALEVGVAWRIDQVLSRKPELQPLYRSGFAYLKSAAKQKDKPGFLALTADEQIEVLTGLSKLENKPEKEFFQSVKALTIEWYYNSEAGLVQELGFKGNTFRTEFPGCTHPEHWPENLNTKA